MRKFKDRSKADFCLTPLGQKIVEENLGLVYYLLKRMNIRTGGVTRDLASLGEMALINAVAYFNPKYGTKLSTIFTYYLLKEFTENTHRSRTITVPHKLLNCTSEEEKEYAFDRIGDAERASKVLSMHSEEGEEIYRKEARQWNDDLEHMYPQNLIDALDQLSYVHPRMYFAICSLYGIRGHFQLPRNEICGILKIRRCSIQEFLSRARSQIREYAGVEAPSRANRANCGHDKVCLRF